MEEKKEFAFCDRTRPWVNNAISTFDVSLLPPLWQELLVFLLLTSCFLPLPAGYPEQFLLLVMSK